MKTLFLILGLSVTAALAEPPNQPSRARYQRLASDSPFTTKPVTEDVAPPKSEIDDWALGGITKFKDGYYALLIDKKDPTKRQVIGKGDLEDWKVERVTYGKDGWRGTKVRVNSGRFSGDVEFDDKLVSVKVQTPPPAQQQQQQGRPNIPGQPNVSGSSGRAPRPRVVTPPQANSNNGNNGNNRGATNNSSQRGSSQQNQRFSRGRGR